MAYAGNRRFPGFGLPIHHIGRNEFPIPAPYRDIFTGSPELAGFVWRSNGVAVRELRMLDFMGQITDKTDWHIIVHNDDIVSCWRAESSHQVNGDVYLSEKMFDFVCVVLHSSCLNPLPTNKVSANLAVVHS